MGGGLEIAGCGFSKNERLRTRPEIDRVFKEGRRYSVKGMRLHVLSCPGAPTRVAFVTVRAYPGAVQRNRARRILRECWRLDKAGLRGGFEVVVVLYPGFDGFETRQAQLRRLIRQAGLLLPA